MRGLRRCVDDGRRFELGYEMQNRLSIANVYVVMAVSWNLRPKPGQNPARVSFGSKERSALIIVKAGYAETESMEIRAYF